MTTRPNFPSSRRSRKIQFVTCFSLLGSLLTWTTYSAQAETSPHRNLLPSSTLTRSPIHFSRNWLHRLTAGKRQQPGNRAINGAHQTELAPKISGDDGTSARRHDGITNEETDGKDLSPSEHSAVTSTQRASPFSSLLGGLSALLHDQKQLVQWAASGVQLGLILYLAHLVWQAAVDVVDEYTSEMSGQDPLYLKRQDVSRVVSLLEQSPRAPDSRLLHLDSSQSPRSPPPAQTLQIAQKLVAAGLPLRSKGDGLPSVENLLYTMTRFEASLLQQCLWTPPVEELSPDRLEKLWSSIAGLQSVKDHLLGTLSAIRDGPSRSFTSLFQGQHGASGVLLYGPPGCGKTAMVRALATTARLPCLVVTPSVLLRKYVGETNLQVRSLFSLASKLAPCILCIDELDGLFRERSEHEHEVSRDLKTEFLQWWDGMSSGSATAPAHQILVVAATNRPFDVDSAVLRRLPQSYYVGLPDLASRSIVLTQLLEDVPVLKDLDIYQIAVRTEGYTPSDIRQVLQTAVLVGPMRESSRLSPDPAHQANRSLSMNDVLKALDLVGPTPLSPGYRAALSGFARSFPLVAPSSQASPSKWDTEFGTFYDVGTLEVDNETFDVLSGLAKNIEDKFGNDSGDDLDE